MALKNPKTPVAPFPEIKAVNLEAMIADELINDLDWQKVRQALIDRARQKFWVWLSSQLLPTEGMVVITNEIEAIAIGEVNNDQ